MSTIGSTAPCGNCGAEPTSYDYTHKHIISWLNASVTTA